MNSTKLYFYQSQTSIISNPSPKHQQNNYPFATNSIVFNHIQTKKRILNNETFHPKPSRSQTAHPDLHTYHNTTSIPHSRTHLLTSAFTDSKDNIMKKPQLSTWFPCQQNRTPPIQLLPYRYDKTNHSIKYSEHRIQTLPFENDGVN